MKKKAADGSKFLIRIAIGRIGLILFFIPFIASGQDTLEMEKYEKAIASLWENVYNKKAFNIRFSAEWFTNDSGFWYADINPEGKMYKKYELDSRKLSPLFNHQHLATALDDFFNVSFSSVNLPIKLIALKDSGRMVFSYQKKQYCFDTISYKISPYEARLVKDEKDEKLQSLSPDKRYTAFTKDYNLVLKDNVSGELIRLTSRGKKNYEAASYYGWFDLMKGENGERPENFSVNWSDDSRFLQTYFCDLQSANKMYLLDYSQDSLFRPELLSYFRGSPGDSAMVYMHPIIFDVEKAQPIQLSLPATSHINQIEFQWSAKKGRVYASWLSRGFKTYTLLSIDLVNNAVDTLYIETSKTSINNISYWKCEKLDKLILASEKDGWRQLYTIDIKNGDLQPLSQGEFFVNDIKYIDEESGLVYFMASGREPGRNPYLQHLYSISLHDGVIGLLTPEDAHHEVSFSPSSDFFIDHYSSIVLPSETVLRSTKDGEIISRLARADTSMLQKEGWHLPRAFHFIGRDEKTKLYGAMWFPYDFDSTLTYPVIDQSYTGPHTHVFPENFSQLFYGQQALANLGFIVVVIDGLGTSGRSREFREYSYKNLGEGLLDHQIGIRSLAKQHSWIDTTRVGIYGHSAGGYDAAHALLRFPGFYKVAVASSGDHDHRMEKAWWPEMYMGWPVDSAYHLQSNITMADQLMGKLLLVHGGLDHNVNPSATFKLSEALIKANKNFDLLIIPSQHHGYSGNYKDYFLKRRWNYFVKHLLNKEPLWEIGLIKKNSNE